MEIFDRQPPRFVPTLTDVVPEGLPIRKPQDSNGHDDLKEPTFSPAEEQALLKPSSGYVPEVARSETLAPAPTQALEEHAWKAEPVFAVEVEHPREVPPSALSEEVVDQLVDKLMPRLLAHCERIIAQELSHQQSQMMERLETALCDSIRDAVHTSLNSK